jgi:hypothetical protein
MGIRLALLALVLLACSKDNKDGAAGGGSAKVVEEKPTEGTGKLAMTTPPPPGPKSKLGEKTGDDFAKIDPWGGGATKVPTFADKIEVDNLDKPIEDKIDLKSLTAANTETVGFKVVYNPSKNSTHEQYRKLFENNRVFEEVAGGLNKTIRLPVGVDINTVDCNTINAFYDPNNKRIIMCYELVSYFLSIFKPVAKTEAELGNAVLGALTFAFFHEAGHGLIHLLELPAVGREEDSVDQLATLILIASGDEGVAMALSGAYWFQLQGKGGHKTPFWDEHAFDEQRFYNVLCLIYGSDPKKYGEFVTTGNLPKDRAARCPDEYAKINKAWEKLLQPHLTNGAALNVAYKPPVPVKEAPKTTKDGDPWGEDDGDGGGTTTVTADEDDDEPTQEPTKAIGVTCEQVAEKAAELIADEARERAKQMDEDEVEQLKTKLEHELPAIVEQLIAQCAKENWSEASRTCGVKSKTLAQASKCN